MNNFIISKNEKLMTPIVYEVIRVINKKPLFLNDHLIRLKNSITHFSKVELDIDFIKKNIRETIKTNNIVNQNIRIELGSFNKESFSYKVFPIESNYPSEEVYFKGVNCITIFKDRESPEIKIRNDEFKSYIKDQLKLNKAYEAILIAENKKILEGSRSNLFFTKDNKIFTSKSGDVLEGVTLKNVIRLIKKEKFGIIRRDIYKDEISQFDGAFLTGTSIDILPINTIDSFKIKGNENEVILKLIEKFKEIKQNDIRGDI